jgi:hypothetical protein
MSVRKKLLSAGAALGIVTAAVFTAVPASAAAPSNCNTWKSGNTAYVVCYSGGGAYAASVACERWNWFGQRLTSFYNGPVKPIGQISKVTCETGQLYSHGYSSWQ